MPPGAPPCQGLAGGKPPGRSDSLVARFLDYIREVRGYSELTARAYSSDLADLRAFLADSGVEDLTKAQPRHFHDYAQHLARDRRPSTVRRKLDCASSLYRHLVALGVVERNPLALVPRPRRARRVPRVPSNEDCRDLLVACGTLREQVAIALLLTLGLRRAELIGADRADLADDLSALRVCGKGNAERVLPVPPATQRLLRQYFEENHPGADPLVPSKTGTRLGPTSLHRMLRRIARRAGLEGRVTCHSLRHRFASSLIENGVDVGTLAALMGHRSASTTLQYVHASAERKASAVAEWGERLLGDAPEGQGGGRR